MTRKHFENWAATIASDTVSGTPERGALVTFAKGIASKANSQFDADRFDARIAQYDSGARNPVTYLNTH